MRIASILVKGEPALGVRTPRGMLNVTALDAGVGTSLRGLLERGPDVLTDLARHVAGAPVLSDEEFTYRPLVPEPSKFLCLGLNYVAHAAEATYEAPKYPVVFSRVASGLLGHGEPMVVPACSSQLDYEAELAVVVGRPGRHIPKERALEWVAGYTLFNDGSIRDYQKRTHQWTVGKNFDATGPLGPELVTPDELPAGARGLRIQMRVNGEVLQDASTSDMIFDVATVLADLSVAMTLQPGDVIAMGTPSGVGAARNPPRFLREGDVCEVIVEGVGVLKNPVVRSP
ncbi:2-keto-4-pentenoate hydratase/2-oxohepta-3-ene-1,7-dioic acid hydratase (catechol pathway) [Myxococcus fulvus]|uniref:2-keto-4-pentenoate hydratase/2-oxohepta-3-ene-1,7-dioic acid hydratase (Catechol pathway) n=1 Tax=Myxococcus fulvus TaxID=33 RepID=A0A511TCY8_MYXFU|nr:fumarylacetoacetate hydrolase family protein [Myxococcus fulvus]GEN12050.1 5-oxopent-3-ene-1,2,5-tricarboxylate decarboxylase [Myxococcus fulvus]SEU36720.1 2-keto-4-pentenoate hydratase/2-oxohepta-3-ene-1,7-dioic acid hydratase (catechol pathway) [Myxococcus fulvus]